MNSSTDQGSGASANADQALAVPVEPSGLAPPGFDPSRIAKRLTVQQRRDLVASNERIWWTADGRVSNEMHRKGLIEAPTWSGSALLTPLGQKVREAAIAMEARQGGDGETRPHPKDDSAGPKDIAQGKSHD